MDGSVNPLFSKLMPNDAPESDFAKREPRLTTSRGHDWVWSEDLTRDVAVATRIVIHSPTATARRVRAAGNAGLRGLPGRHPTRPSRARTAAGFPARPRLPDRTGASAAPDSSARARFAWHRSRNPSHPPLSHCGWPWDRCNSHANRAALARAEWGSAGGSSGP